MKATLTTTQRGLGWKHQNARKAALARLTNGTPCPRCGLPMYRTQLLDLDHKVPRVLGGTNGPTQLTHRRCNRKAGAVIGHKLRRRRTKRTTTTIRQWE